MIGLPASSGRRKLVLGFRGLPCCRGVARGRGGRPGRTEEVDRVEVAISTGTGLTGQCQSPARATRNSSSSRRLWVGSHKFSYPKRRGGLGDWSVRRGGPTAT
jgi:hypothetical protein